MANLIGASLPDAARVTSNVLFVVGAILGTCNVIILYSGRSYIPYLYTHDSDVAELAAATLPINAAFQLFDAIAAQCNGMLRGLGKQKIGGYVSLFSFYGVSCPSGVSERAARLTSTSNNLARTPRLLRYGVRPWMGPHWPVVRTGNRVVCAGHIGIDLRLEDELPEGQRGCCQKKLNRIESRHTDVDMQIYVEIYAAGISQCPVMPDGCYRFLPSLSSSSWSSS